MCLALLYSFWLWKGDLYHQRVGGSLVWPFPVFLEMTLSLLYALRRSATRRTKKNVCMTLTWHFPRILKEKFPWLRTDDDLRLPLAAERHRTSDLVSGVPSTHRDAWNKFRTPLPFRDVGGCVLVLIDSFGLREKYEVSRYYQSLLAEWCCRARWYALL